MDQRVSRRKFLEAGSWTCGALTFGGMILAPTTSTSGQETPKGGSGKIDKGPPLDKELVREFVGAAHGKLERTQEMLASHPTLINATWDWGGGDWETGLGGASHMGRRDIALYLLSKNARIDIFAAAMLGKLDMVKAAITAFPEVRHVPGPHGITLLKHAEAGGEEAAAVLDYLKSLP